MLVPGTAHQSTASVASVRPRLPADYLIHSAVDISHARQQGNTRPDMPAASSLVRNVNINGFGVGLGAENVVALSEKF